MYRTGFKKRTQNFFFVLCIIRPPYSIGHPRRAVDFFSFSRHNEVRCIRTWTETGHESSLKPWAGSCMPNVEVRWSLHAFAISTPPKTLFSILSNKPMILQQRSMGISRGQPHARVQHTNLKIHISGNFGVARQAPDATAALGIGVMDVETIVLRDGNGSITRPETIVPLGESNAPKPVSLEKLNGFQIAGRLQLCDDI